MTGHRFSSRSRSMTSETELSTTSDRKSEKTESTSDSRGLLVQRGDNSFNFKRWFARKSEMKKPHDEDLSHRQAIVGRTPDEEFSLINYEMMLDCVRGLAYIHSVGYMHCDIKSLNFLVTENLRVKISDVGEARPINDAHSSNKKKGHPTPVLNWCPPEVIVPGASMEYTTASDIFGLAMVFSEILIREPPLEQVTREMDYSGWYNLIVEQNIRPVLPGHTLPDVRDLIEAAWNSDPHLRPSADKIVSILAETVEQRRSAGMSFEMPHEDGIKMGKVLITPMAEPEDVAEV